MKHFGSDIIEEGIQLGLLKGLESYLKHPEFTERLG